MARICQLRGRFSLRRWQSQICGLLTSLLSMVLPLSALQSFRVNFPMPMPLVAFRSMGSCTLTPPRMLQTSPYLGRASRASATMTGPEDDEDFDD